MLIRRKSQHIYVSLAKLGRQCLPNLYHNPVLRFLPNFQIHSFLLYLSYQGSNQNLKWCSSGVIAPCRSVKSLILQAFPEHFKILPWQTKSIEIILFFLQILQSQVFLESLFHFNHDIDYPVKLLLPFFATFEFSNSLNDDFTCLAFRQFIP